MKIEWTTIESGKNSTKTKIDTILENKNKISVFFAENKKHLFGAGVSTMAMAFVVGFANISGTEFSANVMFPSLSNEIQEINSNEGDLSSEESKEVGFDSIEGDLDLSFGDDSSIENENKEEVLESNDLFFEDSSQDFEKDSDLIKDENNGENKIPEIENLENNEIKDLEIDETEDLINDLFGIQDDSLEEGEMESEVLSLLNEDNNSEEILESLSEEDNLSLFLENDKSEESVDLFDELIPENEDIFNQNEVEQKIVNEDEGFVFKQNNHTVDMNLVAYNSDLEEIEELHGSMEIPADLIIENISNVPVVENTKVEEVQYVVEKTQKLSQSGPGDMLFGLGFLSIILAYFFRRKKS